MTTIPWLTVLWAVPMVGAAVVILLPAAQQVLAKWLALAISVAVLILAVGLAVGFDPAGAQYQYVESRSGYRLSARVTSSGSTASRSRWWCSRRCWYRC